MGRGDSSDSVGRQDSRHPRAHFLPGLMFSSPLPLIAQ